MTSGPKPSVLCANHMMHTCLVAQHVFCKSVSRMECRCQDGRKGPTEVCVSECQRNMLGMHHQSSTLRQGTSPHNGILSLMTGSPQSQPTLTTCLTSMQTNGPRCSKPALAMANLTMKLKSHCSNQSNQLHVRSRMTPLMGKECFDNKCQH